VPSQWLVEVGDVTLRFVYGLLQTVERQERGSVNLT
jgi:hypothetical protein